MGAFSGAKVFFFISACLFGLCVGQEDISRKAKKWQDSTDDFGNSLEGLEDTESDWVVVEDDGWGSEEDDFWDEGDDDDFWNEPTNTLPPCESLFSDEAIPGENCDNSTVIVPEIRLNDPIFERLIAQVWSDYQYKLNHEKQLYGHKVDPFDVGAKVPERFRNFKQQGTGYTVDVQMHEIKMYGISGIKLDKVEVTRSENLTDMRVNVVFGFDRDLEINGTYALKGTVGWFDIDTNGTQPFSVKLVNATLGPELVIDLIPAEDYNARRCTPTENSLMTQMDNVLIEEIHIPLRYDDIDFRFGGLSNFYNNVVNGVGIYILQTQEENLVGLIRKKIKEHVNSLIC